MFCVLKCDREFIVTLRAQYHSERSARQAPRRSRDLLRDGEAIGLSSTHFALNFVILCAHT